ncbi:MAG: YceH family protein [Pirellulales bacterium]|nr:YceH family protein [Pirellulales bacterium]
MSEPTADVQGASPPKWQPLSGLERRVAGVLVEKAKTTPDAYPMSLNAIRTGCNQKSNRYPVMEVEEDAVLAVLDSLREVGAVGLVQGSGRVERYRHYMYEWLGVDKLELAVMTELLLRGAQTVGDLRGRASRMDPIADLAALRPVLDSLKAKGLLISLTPEGRGQVVTHALYKPAELEKLRAEYSSYAPPASGAEADAADESTPVRREPTGLATRADTAHAPRAGDTLSQSLAAIVERVEELARRVEAQEQALASLRQALGE